MDATSPQCNKRSPSSGCGAIEGFNRSHAILGASDKCIATHPSDMCVALAALDAVVRVRGLKGERQIPIGEFHRLPGDTPQVDTNLQKDELIVSIDLPASPYASHSHYLKVRDRASYEFALVSVAAALELESQKIRSARIVLGGVAHKPWRCENAEKLLIGKNIDAGLFQEAGNVAVTGAKPYQYNAFKIELTKRAVTRALSVAGGMA
jgi:xanthine dehydrogenase YagS FAD-binding subunit